MKTFEKFLAEISDDKVNDLYAIRNKKKVLAVGPDPKEHFRKTLDAISRRAARRRRMENQA